jgi:hypothetical protein
MKNLLLFLLLVGQLFGQQTALQPDLEKVYGNWRNAMLKKDYGAWKSATAAHRQMQVRNMLVSERRAFPAMIFQTPTPLPSLNGLKAMQVKRDGRNAKAVYFGKIDFNVGGTPTDNLIVISFTQETGGWKYDMAEFVNLGGLPDVRAELKKGDLSYIKKTPDFSPISVAPIVPSAVPMAKYIAKVYVFCPGRIVNAKVNKISNHKFGNAKEAETVLGGVQDGLNEIEYSIAGVPGGTGKEALSIRVYLLSQVNGVKPVKAFEYQVNEGGKVVPNNKGSFKVDAVMSKKITVK